MLRPTSILLCPMLLAGCMATKPPVLVKTDLIRDRIPASLLQLCPAPYRKAIKVTGDFIERGDHNEAALKKCAAQVAAIKKWNERP